ncbi:hypothetical protein NLI96_g2463 [Meripilus lineatus]|uniref:Carboxylic ester hydrolase n=1 Tax=Meripilus lineatus TaxID=2056292 RepID=A0AAD5V8K6_9APHY|nr:hypothetical protein NLI96_g2463 [Physisporinus lineatus]
MILFTAVLYSLLLFAPIHGFPLGRGRGILGNPPVFHPGLLCNLPIPVVQQLLCPRQSTPSLNVLTPLGIARGAADGSNAARFAVKYASASRWQPSSLVTTWQLPNGNTDPTKLPLSCPQTGVDGSTMSEDCLSMILYVPNSVHIGSNVPTLVWIHGGTFIFGSATGPGLDGANLAVATNSIVAVIQYRLGALGFLSPSGNTNLAVKDVVNSLKFLKTVLPAFGGDTSRVTVAGQSAGASMIRALLAAPSASSYFRSAIIQSDTMDYGILSTSSQQTLQNFYNTLLTCSSADTACLNGLSIDTILNSQNDFSNNAVNYDASAGVVEPIRPSRDALITSPLDSTAPFPQVSKPLLVTSVRNEAGFTIYGGFPDGLDSATYIGAVTGAFGNQSATLLLAQPSYAIPTQVEGGTQDLRPQLQQMGNDQVWRCPSWTFTRNWVNNGGTVFAGEFMVGATYPGNEQVPFCTQAGSVCHQDDIEIVFGTVPSPTAAQAALTTEVQARYSAFLRTGNPNVSGRPNWPAASGNNVNAIQLGASGMASIGACDPSFWGAAVPYDYQTFAN